VDGSGRIDARVVVKRLGIAGIAFLHIVIQDVGLVAGQLAEGCMATLC
jgi:hypothetical protein